MKLLCEMQKREVSTMKCIHFKNKFILIYSNIETTKQFMYIPDKDWVAS